MVVFDFSLVLFDDMLYYNKVYERDVVDMIDNNTQFFRTQPEKTISVEGILEQVYLALKEKGYNPVNQIVGYIMSGDPTYITSHNNARSLIMKVERDELVEEVIKYFIEGKGLLLSYENNWIGLWNKDSGRGVKRCTWHYSTAC